MRLRFQCSLICSTLILPLRPKPVYIKTIKGVDYHLYENEEEFKKHRKKEKVNQDWRTAQEGEWAISDDGQIFSILRRAVMYSGKYKGDTD